MSDGFKAVGEGRFRVDRGRALDKMERFQLEDPERYVLELVAAAVCAGTHAVDIVNDADDFVLSFRGESPTAEELAVLWDHLFSRDATGRAAMLQHLATGLLGALATSPRWIRLDRGEDDAGEAVRLEVADVMRTEPKPLDDRELLGTRVHVRERVSRQVLAEALFRAFQAPGEARLVQGACGWSPVPIRVNGTTIPGKVAPAVVVAHWPVGKRPGKLWLLPPDVPGAVDVVRHGLVVAHLVLQIGRCAVCGWVLGDELRLNASRSAVVSDEREEALQADVDAALRRLVHEVVPPLITGVEGLEVLRWTGHADAAKLRYRASRAEILRQVVIAGLLDQQEGDAPLEPGPELAALPLVEDVFGRVWSAGALQALEQGPVVLGDVSLADETLGRVQFGARHWPVLHAVVGEVEDLTEVCRARADGRRRRAEAARQRRDPWFGGEEHRFEKGAMRGAVRLLPVAQERSELRVHLRLAGLTVQTVSLPSPAGALEAIADHPDFLPDHAFLHIIDTPALREALTTVTEQARAFVESGLRRGLRGRDRDRWMRIWVDLLLDAKPGKALLRACIDGLPEALVSLAALRGGDGTWRSLRDVVAAPVTEPWWVIEQQQARDLPGLLAAQVLLVPDGERKAWRRVLKGCSRRGARESLDKAAVRQARLARPRRSPRLEAPGPVSVTLDSHGMRGMLCYLPPAMRREEGSEGVWPGDFAATAREVERDLGGPRGQQAQIGVLREGVFIQVCAVRSPLAGVAGWVDWPRAPVDDAMTALRPDGLDAVTRAVGDAVDELAASAWSHWSSAGRTEELPDDLARWLARRRKRRKAVVRRMGEAIIGTTSSGAPFTVADLARKRRADAPLVLASRRPDQEVPGLGEVLVCGELVAEAVRAWSKGRVVDGDARIAEAERALRRFLRNPRAPRPQPGLAERVIDDEHGRWHLCLPDDPATIAQLCVEVRWRDRVLQQRDGAHALGVRVTVEGAAFSPDAELRAVMDGSALERALSRGREILAELVGEALRSGRGSPEIWRALATRAWERRRPGSKALRSSGVLAPLEQRPLFTGLDGTPVSATELRAHRDDGALIGWVSEAVVAGPSEHPGLVRDEPYVRGALAGLVGETSCADEVLVAWRQAEARRRSLPRMEPVLAMPVLCRQALPEPHEGEVGLTDEEGGLVVHPLVDGLPMEPIHIDFPVAGHAVVQGPAVRANASLTEVEGGRDFSEVLDGIRRLAGELAEGLCLQQMRRDPEQRVAWRWVTRNRRRSRSVATAPVFPTLGPGVSYRDLERRQQRDGGIGVVSAPGEALPGEVQPVQLSEPLLAALLEERFTLVELDEVAGQARAGPDLGAPVPGLLVHRMVDSGGISGWLGIRTDRGQRDRVRLERVGVQLDEVELRCPLPVLGEVEVDWLVPDALWRGPEEKSQVSRVRRQLMQQGAPLMEALIQEARRPAVRERLRQALRLAVDGVEALDAKGWVAAASALPLFSDSQGSPGSLREMLAETPVRTVSPGESGRWHPSRSRVWQVGEAEHRWLQRIVGATDASSELRLEELGHQRQEGPEIPWDAPSEAHWFALEDRPVRGALWVGTQPRGVEIRVRGHIAGTLMLAGPLVHGVVEGPFATSVSFTDPVLGEEIAAAICEELGHWLHRLGSRRAWPVLLEAVHAWGGREGARAHQAHPILQIVVAHDHTGRPLTFSELDQAITGASRLLWVEEDVAVADPPDAEPVVVDRDGAVDRIRELFPSVALVHVAERIELEGLPEPASDSAELTELRGEVEALASSWGTSPHAVRQASRAWFGEHGAPRWLLAGQADRRVLTLAAWRLATYRPRGVPRREEELAVLEAVLAALV